MNGTSDTEPTGTSGVKRGVIIAILLIVALLGAATVAGAALFLPVSQDATEVSVSLPAGIGVNGISRRLRDAGVIRSTTAFETYVWARGIEDNLKAGEYTFPRSLTLVQLVRRLSTGEGASNEVSLLVIEGLTRTETAVSVGAQLAQARSSVCCPSCTCTLTTDPEAIEAEFMDLTELAAVYAESFPYLDTVPTGGSLEGFLYPDTYRVFRDASTADVVWKMLENFDRRIHEGLRSAYDARGLTLNDAVTVASLLESEVRTSEDRRMVTDIIARRIEAGMPLQLDATITYLTGRKSADLTPADLGTDSPYNTYRNQGLPPGPISNPGLSSFEAVADPLPNEFLYYLTARTGETIYSRTFEEHVANKQQYL
ncbi:MAG: endolytic transglycosylase MltG [Candidatus Kerfeldbacteria bacterium]|nr:endolytic transglycosylase MltG [Candidatus Kerfeldbacteria bacterium]